MEKETLIGQASDTIFKGRWVKVQIYTPSHIWTGYAYCPAQRLLDVLNLTLTNEEFLPVSEVKVRSVDGGEATLQSAYINKANILFVSEIESGQTRGLGGQAGHKPYPFVPKWSTAVRVYIPSYTLTGRMHYAKGKGIADVLNSGLRFFPLTNVKICSSASSEPEVSFTAINKRQILSVEELGIPTSHPSE